MGGGGKEEYIKIGMQTARRSFFALRNVWKLKEIKTTTTLRIFKSSIKSLLLYGSETRSTKTITNKLQ